MQVTKKRVDGNRVYMTEESKSIIISN